MSVLRLGVRLYAALFLYLRLRLYLWLWQWATWRTRRAQRRAFRRYWERVVVGTRGERGAGA